MSWCWLILSLPSVVTIFYISIISTYWEGSLLQPSIRKIERISPLSRISTPVLCLAMLVTMHDWLGREGAEGGGKEEGEEAENNLGMKNVKSEVSPHLLLTFILLMLLYNWLPEYFTPFYIVLVPDQCAALCAVVCSWQVQSLTRMWENFYSFHISYYSTKVSFISRCGQPAGSQRILIV